MTVHVMGVIRDPLGKPLPQATVRITTVNSEETPKGSMAEVAIGVDGSYDFNLFYGSFSVAMKQEDEFEVDTLVDVGVDTPNPITLSKLLNTN